MLAPNPGSGGVRGTRTGHLPRRPHLSSGLNWISAERLRRHTQRYGLTVSLIRECFGASPPKLHMRSQPPAVDGSEKSDTFINNNYIASNSRACACSVSEGLHQDPTRPSPYGYFGLRDSLCYYFSVFPAVRRQGWKGILLRHMRVKQGYFVVVLAGAAGFDS